MHIVHIHCHTFALTIPHSRSLVPHPQVQQLGLRAFHRALRPAQHQSGAATQWAQRASAARGGDGRLW